MRTLHHSRLLTLSPLLAGYVVASVLRQPGTLPSGDEGPFLRLTRHILDGYYAVPHSSDAITYLWHGPGLPLFLTPFVALGTPLVALRISGALLLFAAVVLFERVLALRLSPRAALAGAWAIGLYLPFGSVLGTLHKEPLALALVVAAMYATTRLVQGGGRRHVVAAGLALGALVWTRLEYGWVMLVLLGLATTWALCRPRRPEPRRLACVGLVALACCLPWLAYTTHITGRPLYWGNAGGLSLYWMSVPGSNLGQWHAVHSVFSDPRLAHQRAFFRRLESMTPLRRDLELQHVALRQIARNPAPYARNLAANGSRMWFATPFSFQLPKPVFALDAGSNLALLAGLAWVALALARRRRRLPPGAGPFAAFAGVAAGIHLVFSAEPRMMLPLVPVIAWVVVQGLARAGRAASV
jgi:4-amino-4-deoxy-L-arabinose transferase-like glycosyltransferase